MQAFFEVKAVGLWVAFFNYSGGLHGKQKIAECNLQKHLSERLIESIMQDICDAPKELQHQCDILLVLVFCWKGIKSYPT